MVRADVRGIFRPCPRIGVTLRGNRGEIVELRFDGPFGPTTGGHLSKKALANATITVAKAKLIPGDHDLPRI